MKIKYEKHLCAFLDILGYSKLIENASSKKKAIAIINHINNAIEKGVKRNLKDSTNEGDAPSDGIRYKIFSDNISLSVPYPNTNYETLSDVLFSFIYTIIFIQAELINEGIFIRGGISSDYHFENDNMIFSKALLKSYYLESKESVYPRIIIDNVLLKELRSSYDDNDATTWDKIIIRDPDLYYFIDYLSYVEDLEYDEDRENYLKNHKNLILKNIHSTNNAYLLTKYIWLAKYHNYKIIQLSGNDNDPLIIENSLLSLSNSNFEPYAYILFYKIKKRRKIDVNVYLYKHQYHAITHLKTIIPNSEIIDIMRIYDSSKLDDIIFDIKKDKDINSVTKYIYRGNHFYKTI